MPQPKSVAASSQGDPPVLAEDGCCRRAQEHCVANHRCVRNRSLYQAGRNLNSVVEGLAPKSEKTTTLAESNDLAPGIVELSLSPAQGDMKVGEKRQLALALRTGAPLGLAVLTLRFDPQVLKVKSVTAGSLLPMLRPRRL